MIYDGMLKEGICKVSREDRVGLGPYGLPENFQMAQGPSMWRPTPGGNPLDRMTSADAKAFALQELIHQFKKPRSRNPVKRKAQQRDMSRMMDQLMIAQQLGA